MAAQQIRLAIKNADFFTLIGCHGNVPSGPDRSSTNKYLSFGAKIAKIGPADPEIICLRAIIKKDKKRKKLMHAKYIAQSATLPSGLNYNIRLSLINY